MVCFLHTVHAKRNPTKWTLQYTHWWCNRRLCYTGHHLYPWPQSYFPVIFPGMSLRVCSHLYPQTEFPWFHHSKIGGVNIFTTVITIKDSISRYNFSKYCSLAKIKVFKILIIEKKELDTKYTAQEHFICFSTIHVDIFTSEITFEKKFKIWCSIWKVLICPKIQILASTWRQCVIGQKQCVKFFNPSKIMEMVIIVQD